jgi:predicted DCC family thiol-disulfide oxidoreductase YuxK/MFS family permease
MVGTLHPPLPTLSRGFGFPKLSILFYSMTLMSMKHTETMLPSAERRRGQRNALLANLFMGGTQFIVQGVMMMLYANDVLGFTPKRIAYVLAVVPLVALVRLAFLGNIRRIGKIRVLTFTAAARLACIVLLAAIPASQLSFPIFLVILVAYAATQNIGAGAVWQPLLRDITTVEDRGRFFARMRFSFTSVSALISGVIPLFVGVHITEWQFKALLLLAAAGQINNLFWVARIPELRDQTEEPRGRVHLKRLLAAIKTSRLLRAPLMISCIFVVMGIPLYPLYLKQMLNVPSNIVSWLLFAATVGGALSLLLWGHIADQLGFKPMLKGLLYLAILLLPSHVLLIPFESQIDTPQEWVSLVVLLMHGLVGGALGAGTGIAMTSIQHAMVRQQDSIEAMNLFQAATIAIAAMFALAAGVLLEDVAIPAGMVDGLGGWFHIDIIKAYLMVAGVLGSAAILHQLRKIPNTRPYFDTADFFVALSTSPLRVAHAQRNIHHESESKRMHTAHWLGQQANPMVLDSLVELLDDPSYDVRVAAIRGLAETKSALAGEKLLEMLRDENRRSVADHIAWGLGALAYTPARDDLLKELAPDRSVRVRAMAARALGKLGDASAAPALAALLTEESIQKSHHLVSSACRALLGLGDTEHMPQLFHMLNALSTREDRYELMDVLCLYLNISNEWVLKAYSSTSPRDALLQHLSYKSAAWHRDHADLEKHIHEANLDAIKSDYQQAITETTDPVLQGLQVALAETVEWGPLAVMTSAWILLSDKTLTRRSVAATMAGAHTQDTTELFYDGACPVCRREIAFLERHDSEGRLSFSDITAPDFELPGKTQAALMTKIHARLPNGTFIEGVEVFRHVYALLGYRRSVAITRWPIVSPLLDIAYRLFARHRPRRA